MEDNRCAVVLSTRRLDLTMTFMALGNYVLALPIEKSVNQSGALVLNTPNQRKLSAIEHCCGVNSLYKRTHEGSRLRAATSSLRLA
jgi:hypothetical protein